MKAGLYTRVSTDAQDAENQLVDLKRYCQARVWEYEEFRDHGYSGSLSADDRPGLKSLLEAARRRKVDLVMAWDLSRLARSLPQLVEMVNDFRTWGITLITVRDNIDTSTANGRMIFGIFATIAEFERELTRERTRMALKRLKDEGVKLGRPEIDKQQARVIMLRAEGKSIREIERITGVNRQSVFRVLRVGAGLPAEVVTKTTSL